MFAAIKHTPNVHAVHMACENCIKRRGKKKWNRSKITAPVSVKTQINSCTAIHRWYIWYLLICLTMLQSFGLLHTYSVPTYAHGVCVYIVRDGKRERRGGGMERQKQRE